MQPLPREHGACCTCESFFVLYLLSPSPPTSLKYLNLNNNEIYAIPRLRLLGTNLLHESWRSPRLSAEELQPAKGFSTKSPLPNELVEDAHPLNGSIEEQCSPNWADKKFPSSKEGEQSLSRQHSTNGTPDQVLQAKKEDLETVKARNKDDTAGTRRQSPALLQMDHMDENMNAHLLAPFPQLKTLSLTNNLVGW